MIDSRVTHQQRQWNLGRGAVMNVVLPHPSGLTREHIARLRRYVDALETEAAICWDDAAAPMPCCRGEGKHQDWCSDGRAMP